MPDNQHMAGNGLDNATGCAQTPCQGVGATTKPEGPTAQMAHESNVNTDKYVDREESHSSSKKKPMKLTAANISRVLTAAGHQKRTAYKSRIRGWKNYSSGFDCTATKDFIVVQHCTDGYDSAPFEAKLSRVQRYMPSLAPHFDCEIVGLDLHVKAKSSKNDAAAVLWPSEAALPTEPFASGPCSQTGINGVDDFSKVPT